MQQCEPPPYVLPRLQLRACNILEAICKAMKQGNVTVNCQGFSIRQALLSLPDCIWEHLEILKGAAWRQVWGAEKRNNSLFY